VFAGRVRRETAQHQDLLTEEGKDNTGRRDRKKGPVSMLQSQELRLFGDIMHAEGGEFYDKNDDSLPALKSERISPDEKSMSDRREKKERAERRKKKKGTWATEQHHSKVLEFDRLRPQSAGEKNLPSHRLLDSE